MFWGVMDSRNFDEEIWVLAEVTLRLRKACDNLGELPNSLLRSEAKEAGPCLPRHLFELALPVDI